MPEQWLLDPTGESTGTQLDISTDPYAVVEFASPAPPLETSMAGTIDTEGDLIAARRHQNRQVSFTVEVVGSSQANLDAAVATLEAKVAELALEGGTFRRVRADGTYRTADILAADSYEKAFDVAYFLGNLARCTVNLIAKPYVRGPEVALTSHSETTLPVLIFTDTIPGDVPATGRLVITDSQGAARRFVTWGVEARYLNTGQPLFWQAESTTLNAGGGGGGSVAATADATASGGSKARFTQTVTSGTFYKVLSVTGSHRGRYRVFARVKTSSASVLFRARWFPMGSDISQDNPQTGTASIGWELIDLGIVSPGSDVSANWTMSLHATAVSGATVDFDTVFLVPILEASGEATGTETLNAIDTSGKFTVSDRYALKGPDGSGNYGPANSYEGDYLRIRPGSVRFLVAASQGIPGYTQTISPYFANDVSIDDLSAQVFYTPRYLSAF